MSEKASGFVTDLSPIKTSKPRPGSMKEPTTYFTGKLQIGQDHYKRMVCFDKDKYDQFADAKKRATYVDITKFVQKDADDDMKIWKSSKLNLRSDLPRFAPKPSSKTVDRLADIGDHQEDDIINITAKVTSISPIEELDKCKGRNLTLRDHTASIRLRLWSDNCDVLDLNAYQFFNLKVKLYQNERYLSFSPETTYEQFDGLTDVAEHCDNTPPEKLTVDSAEVKTIVRCKCNRLVTAANPTAIYRCSNCGFCTKFTKLTSETKIKILDSTGRTYVIPHDALPNDVGRLPADELEVYLLETEIFDIKIERGIIKSFYPVGTDSDAMVTDAKKKD